MKITVLGAGSFGTAFAAHLALFGHEVKMWTRDRERAEHINKYHRNISCFSDTELPCAVSAAYDIAEALEFSEYIVMAIPTQSQREVCVRLSPLVKEGSHMLNLAKGIEISTGAMLHQLHGELCPQLVYSALSGPSHAEELLFDMPTAVALASADEDEARLWQRIVSGGNFRDDMLQLVPIQCPGKDCTNNNLRSRCNVTQLTFACIRVQCLDCGSSFTFYKNN